MKKLFKILAGLVLVIILALIAVPFFVSADMLKGRVAEELSKATGRTITINGNASLKLFPDIAVSLEDVSLSNPQGAFKSKRMFAAKKLETGVKLMPLLSKEIIITGVTLDGAEINLEENAAGEKNWEFAAKSSSETQKEVVKEEGKKKSKLAIGDIAVKGSSVSYVAKGAKPIALSNINISLSGADGTEPLELDGSADYNGETVNVSLDVKDSQGFLAGKASPVALDLSLPGGKVNFEGTAEQKGEIGAEGKLAADIAALPSLMKWATGKPAAPSIPKKVSLSSAIIAKGKVISFGDLKASADSLNANGKLTVDASGNMPSLSGNLHLGKIDTAQFASGAEKAGGSNVPTGNEPAAGGKGWSSEPIDLSGLKAVNAKLGLAIDGVKAGKLEVGAIATNVNLQNGVLQLGLDKAALYGGNASGAVSASSGGIATALDITNVQIEPLMTALNGQSRLSGTGNVKLNVKGAGNSQKAIVNTLNGTLGLSLRDGAVKGINIGKFLRDAKKGFVNDNSSEKTDFAEFSGNFTITNGVASNNDLTLKAPILRMGGSGTINLPARSINYKLTPTLVNSSKGQDGKDKAGITIPLLITGSWDKPAITPDVAGIAQEALKDPEAFKENLKNLKEGVKDFNSPKDILRALGGSKETAPAPATETAPTTTTGTETTAPAAAEQKKPDAKTQAIEGLLKSLSK
jgi:AsmA protein